MKHLFWDVLEQNSEIVHNFFDLKTKYGKWSNYL